MSPAPGTPPARSAAVAAAILRVPHLATLPEIAVKAARLAATPDTSVAQMAGLISRSPDLCTRVLKVVNSAFYGLSGQVGSIDRAVSLMGLDSVKNVVIAASLTRVFQGRRLSPTFSPRDLWTHSLGVAAAARMVTTAVESPLGEEAFLAGLIHDVGVMVELQLDRAKMASLLARLEADGSLSVLDAEDQAFGANHQDFGAGLSRHWKLPPSLSGATAWHHRPLEAPPAEASLAAVVHIADRLVIACQPGFRLDVLDTTVSDAVLDHVGLPRSAIGSILERLPAAIDEAQSFLGGA